MAAQVDYISKTKNRVVVKYTSGITGGDVNFNIGPSVFGPTNGDFATSGLTYTSASLSRIYYSTGGTGGHVALNFVGSPSNQSVWIIPSENSGEINFERMTISNTSTGGTGYAQFDNNLTNEKDAVIIAEFVTHHV
jgi:hypothetical protein